jgi:hypothetical protein
MSFVELETYATSLGPTMITIREEVIYNSGYDRMKIILDENRGWHAHIKFKYRTQPQGCFDLSPSPRMTLFRNH